jgi:hypothetical protein
LRRGGILPAFVLAAVALGSAIALAKLAGTIILAPALMLSTVAHAAGLTRVSSLVGIFFTRGTSHEHGEDDEALEHASVAIKRRAEDRPRFTRH